MHKCEYGHGGRVCADPFCWLRDRNDPVTLAAMRDKDMLGLREQNTKLEAEAQALREEVAALRARVVIVQEPVTMDGKTTIREHVANAAPVDLPMCAWTQGYEECKRRIHAMFEQPCNKRLNGKAVSEGLLRSCLADLEHHCWDKPHVEELRALLGEGKESGDA